MAHKFAEIAFTPSVKDVQAEMGSRKAYTNMDSGEFDYAGELTDDEISFIESRDSFYMASVSETEWPYMQHRGGSRGFIGALDGNRIGFLDYRGNRQYISVGNIRKNDRVSLFFMDYPSKTRLKLLGHARVATVDEAEALGLKVADGYRAHPERAFVIDVAGFDWNCPQHITERYTLEDLRSSIQPLHDRIAELEKQLDEARKTRP